MKIIFAGTPQFAVSALEGLVGAGHDIALVLTRPDRARGRGLTVTPPPVKTSALAHGIEVIQPANLASPEITDRIREIAPEAAVVAAYRSFVPVLLLDLPRHGWLNIHPSFLPKYRGPSPVRSALLNGEKTTGVSVIRLTPEMDSGPILLQEEVETRETEDASGLYGRLAEVGARLIVEALALLGSGGARFCEQDHDAATFCATFGKRDGIIDWSSDNLLNHVRAMTPWPGARTGIRPQMTSRPIELAVTGAVQAGEAPAGEPGLVVGAGREGIVVQSGGGAILVTRVKPAGRKEMSAFDFANGYRIAVGDLFQWLEKG